MFALSFFNKTFNFLKDDNHPLLGPHLKILNFSGLWHFSNDRRRKLKLFVLYMTIAFFFSLYIKCCINISLDNVMAIIQYAPFHTGVVKTAFFVKDSDKWYGLIAYISSIEREELSKGDPKIKRIIGGYIKYSHRLTYFFWVMAILSNLSIFGDLYQKVYGEKNLSEEYINIFNGYTPWNRDPPGYYYIFITQTFFANMVTLYVMGWDTLIVAIMIFFASQLKISGIYCERVVDVNSSANSQRNIAECHRFHTTLVNIIPVAIICLASNCLRRHQEAFNSLISPVMFVYLVVISVNLGVCIIEMAELQNNFGALLSYCVYVLACLVQLLLFYWHSNEVTEESILVSYGTFRSQWVGASVPIQRGIAILAHVTNKKIVFQAGPFNEMSLTTFVSILRGSYSFYTLLNETN